MEKKDSENDLIVHDYEPANIRKSGGVNIQRIPKKWLDRRDFKRFFESDLEIALVHQNGQPMILIRTVPRDDVNEER